MASWSVLTSRPFDALGFLEKNGWEMLDTVFFYSLMAFNFVILLFPSKEVVFIPDFDFVCQFLHYVAVFPHISIEIWLCFLMSVTTSCHSPGLHVFAGCTGGCARTPSETVITQAAPESVPSKWYCWESVQEKSSGGGTIPISSICYFLLCVCLFSESSRHSLPIRYYIHISQMSPQFSCGDTYQIWNWFKI